MAITLIVEDGTGTNPAANSYIDSTFMSNYAELQGSDIWCDNTSKQNLALVQASAFLDLRYSARYCGEVVNESQGLLFPRKIKGKESGIPTALKNAVAQLALQFLTDGTLDLNANSDMAVSSETVSVGNGAVSESRTYFKESSRTPFSAFAIADRYVNQLMINVGCECRSGAMFIPALRG